MNQKKAKTIRKMTYRDQSSKRSNRGYTYMNNAEPRVIGQAFDEKGILQPVFSDNPGTCLADYLRATYQRIKREYTRGLL